MEIFTILQLQSYCQFGEIQSQLHVQKSTDLWFLFYNIKNYGTFSCSENQPIVDTIVTSMQRFWWNLIDIILFKSLKPNEYIHNQIIQQSKGYSYQKLHAQPISNHLLRNQYDATPS